MPLIGLIGYPLSHSFSPAYFKKRFEENKMPDWDYRLFPMQDLSELDSLLQTEKDICALNVTIPHKQSVLKFCHSISDEVKEIGAANLLLINRGAKDQIQIHACNTDVYGFSESLTKWYPNKLGKALVMGTGGASKAVQYALSKLNIDFIVVGRQTIPAYQDLQLKDYDLIINCSPAGMKMSGLDDLILPLNFAEISHQHFYYDLVYNPETTSMMSQFSIRGASVKNGLEMLYLQADKAFQMIVK